MAQDAQATVRRPQPTAAEPIQTQQQLIINAST